MKQFLLLWVILATGIRNHAQPACKDALKINRERLYNHLVKNSIQNNLTSTLADSTEENWEDAFHAMELIRYRSPWVNNRIRSGMAELSNRSIPFQQAFLELIYSNYPSIFYSEVAILAKQTTDTRVFILCAEYLIKGKRMNGQQQFLLNIALNKYHQDPENPLLFELIYRLRQGADIIDLHQLHLFFEKTYLPKNTLLISFQRKDRNYPGLVLIRDTNGIFTREPGGKYFAVPQLAKSINDLPPYLTNGNTPQGIFRMDGFDHSKSSFIGPTENIQLTLPFEFKASHFFRDSTLNDSSWDLNLYKKLLPEYYRNYIPLQQSFFAGKAGRNEIIAHGTTVNPSFYKNTAYYPLTPTLGCLCTKEIWNETTGILMESDQQRLVDALSKAGGPNGYAIVIEINDKKEPVKIEEILPFLKLGHQK